MPSENPRITVPNMCQKHQRLGLAALDSSPPSLPPCAMGVYCREHGFIHGAEADELRERLEALENDDVTAILDDVDARDSLAYQERQVTAAALAAPPEAAPTRDCADDVCQAAKHDGILCADGECDYHAGTRKPPEAAPTSEPDTAEWWRQVAQGLGVEVARMKRLAKEATNGWACHATRKREHDEIARLHREINAHVAEFGEGDDIRVRAAQRAVLEGLRAELSSQESVGSCSTVPSSSPGSGCEGQQGTGGSGSSEVSWREAVEAGWDDGVRFASEVLRSQVFPRDSARAACVDRVMAVIRLPSPIPPEAD